MVGTNGVHVNGTNGTNGTNGIKNGIKKIHPFDPLSEAEIANAVSIVNAEHAGLFFNTVTVLEPKKKEMMAWLVDPVNTPKPHRIADVVAIGKGSKVYDGLVDLTEGKIIQWELTDGVQPLVCESYPFQY
jgi:primary-amine oxidase